MNIKQSPVNRTFVIMGTTMAGMAIVTSTITLSLSWQKAKLRQ